MFARINKAMEDKEQGFTLIELLVVMIIIGILAAIAIPTFLSQRQNGYRTTLKADLKNAATGLESAAVGVQGNYLTAAGAAGGAAVVFPAAVEFNKSATDTIYLNAVSATDYCISGINSGLAATEIWYFVKSGASGGVPTSTKPAGCV